MEKPLPELITYLENYNVWRRGPITHHHWNPKELGFCIDQAVDVLKTMTWQPMETAPTDREFLGVWGSTSPPLFRNVNVFKYTEDGEYCFGNMPHQDAFLPNEFCKIFAWMDIPKFDLR
jgi:hypothetical protein